MSAYYATLTRYSRVRHGRLVHTDVEADSSDGLTQKIDAVRKDNGRKRYPWWVSSDSRQRSTGGSA